MAKAALLVNEMQNDYLWEKRKDKFPYDTEKLTAAVNSAIEAAQSEGADVIYLAQIFPDTPTNHLVFGFSIEGTEGAKLYQGLKVVSELYFEKNVANPFLLPEFCALIEQNGYEELRICGIDEKGGVSAAAKGAAERGIHAVILKDAVATRFPLRQMIALRTELKSLGVVYRAGN